MALTSFTVPQYNAHYEGQYDDRALQWRRVGAADKTANILRLLGGKKPTSLLEVGCGTGAVLASLAAHGLGSRHTGVDLADPSSHTDPQAKRLDLRVFDGNTLPFGNGEFEFVYASHVVEHVPEPRKMLAEMRRVASKFIYLEVPCELHLRTNRRALQQSLNIGHINAYTPESFQLLLETSGLPVSKMQVFDHSYALHRIGSGPVKAAVKAALRGGLLSLSPTLASRVFTYHCGALIELS
jgi:SAM-dependent methyltransferase